MRAHVDSTSAHEGAAGFLRSMKWAAIGLLACGASLGWTGDAVAQGAPGKPPITFVVTYPAGGGADVMARLMADAMSETLGQTIVVENKPGASGRVAAAAVAKAAPDGTTVMVDASSFAIIPARYPKLNYDPKSFRAIGIAALFPHVLVVTPAFAATSAQDLVARAKAAPGAINFASSGSGSAQHLAGALFMMRTGIEMNHVPYRGGAPAMNDVMGGHVNVFFANVASGLTFMQAGKLRPLAVSGDRRLPGLPDVATLAELGITGAELYEWNGFFVPGGTPDDVVNRLADALQRAKQTPAIRDRIASLGGEMFAGGPTEAARFIVTETERMVTVVKAANIGPE
ncbi:MAG: tripartite tricarboxylate transporter substrate binding protein [Hyphomicrobiaceae bacterium]|nr:tripartite tricarboxylate transporter substrate binding protein [Hyphomicrobiaceae bacterium]